MRTITRVSLAIAAAAVLVGAPALSATAAPTGDSLTTVAVAGGTLDIAVPAALALTSTGPGVAATGTLGTVTVTDDRASNLGWASAITTTAFTSSVDVNSIIPGTDFGYTASAAAGTGAGVPTFATPATVTGGATATAVQTATASGNNGATWTAAVTLAVPANALAGNYTGTVTHSVL